MWELVLTRANGTYYEHTKTNKPLLAHQALFVLSKYLFRTAVRSLLLGLLEPNKYSANLGSNPSKLNMEAARSYWTLECMYMIAQCPNSRDH